MMAKKTKIPFRLTQIRDSADLQAQCYADLVLFEPWDKMTEDARDEFTKNGPIPCEGGGVPGEWCADCRFGKLIRID